METLAFGKAANLFRPLSFYHPTGTLLSLIKFDIMKLTVLIRVLLALSAGRNEDICFGQYSFGNCKNGGLGLEQSGLSLIYDQLYRNRLFIKKEQNTVAALPQGFDVCFT